MDKHKHTCPKAHLMEYMLLGYLIQYVKPAETRSNKTFEGLPTNMFSYGHCNMVGYGNSSAQSVPAKKLVIILFLKFP